MQYVNVKALADGILDNVANKMATIKEPKSLLILYAGDDPASASYMKGKIKDCGKCGIPVRQIKCETEQALAYNICMGNLDQSIGGIIVQLPLPEGWNEDGVVNMVSAIKDVDGFVEHSAFKPCTPEGIVRIMKSKLGDDLRGKRALIVGRGKLVGKPLGQMLQYDEGMSVMQVGSTEPRIDELVRGLEWSRWDVIVSAVGKPGLVDLSPASVYLAIDAGITKGEDGKLHGDFCGFEEDDRYAVPAVTPVPGGVGLMTRAMLMEHMMEVQ